MDDEINYFADSVSAGKRIFIMGGVGPTDEVFEADVKNRVMIEKKHMLCNKYRHTLFHADAHIYSIGGYDGSSSLNDCEKYDVLENQWCLLPTLCTSRFFSAVFIRSNCVFAFCGFTGRERMNTMERLKLSSCDKWEILNVSTPPSVRYGMHGISICDGAIVFGGYDDDGRCKGCYLLRARGEEWDCSQLNQLADSAFFCHSVAPVFDGSCVYATDRGWNIHVLNESEKKWELVKH